MSRWKQVAENYRILLKREQERNAVLVSEVERSRNVSAIQEQLETELCEVLGEWELGLPGYMRNDLLRDLVNAAATAMIAHRAKDAP